VAGLVAKKMGLPIEFLVVATNENNIVERLINKGELFTENVVKTVSCSMDIQIPYNIERLLFMQIFEKKRNARTAASMITEWMKLFETTNRMQLSEEWIQWIKDSGIRAGSANSEQTLCTMSNYYKEKKYLLDPHTAVGIYVSTNVLNLHNNRNIDLVCLATAHPAKFIEAVEKALGSYPDLEHQKVSILKKKPTNLTDFKLEEDIITRLKLMIEENYYKN